jgi:hypothetical protein
MKRMVLIVTVIFTLVGLVGCVDHYKKTKVDDI